MFLAPGHVEGFPQPKIHVRVARQANIIPWASFARIGVAEILVNRLDIATAATEELRCTSTHRGWRSNACRASVERVYGNDVGLVVPVRRPAGVIEWRPGRQSGVPAEDAGELPSSKNYLSEPVRIAQEGSALAKRHLPHGGSVDEVPDVKVRVAVVGVLANRILNKRTTIVLAAEAKVRLQSGRVI